MNPQKMTRIREYPNRKGYGLAEEWPLVIAFQLPLPAMILFCWLAGVAFVVEQAHR